jgi:hypothetical protein
MALALELGEGHGGGGDVAIRRSGRAWHGITVSEYMWEPLTPGELQAVYASVDVQWWVAGGVALDLFVGRETRAHSDIDTAVLRRDVQGLAPLRATWDVCIVRDGRLTPWDGGELSEEHHQFWVRRPGAEAWAFEILLEMTDAADWVYRRDARIRRPVASIGRQTDGGISYLAPEIVLLYKSFATDAKRYAARNTTDFGVALPLLDATERRWLREALTVIDDKHPWIPRL